MKNVIRGCRNLFLDRSVEDDAHVCFPNVFTLQRKSEKPLDIMKELRHSMFICVSY